ARPDELHRRARHLLRDQDGLGHVVSSAAPAKSATQQQLMDVALLNWYAGCLRRRSQRWLRVLRAGPDLTFLVRIKRRCVQRLHARVSLVWIVIHSLDRLGRIGNGTFDVALLVTDKSLLGIEPTFQKLGNRRARG